jgi:hypothetical protein
MRRWCALAVVGAALAGACSSGGGDEAAPRPTATTSSTTSTVVAPTGVRHADDVSQDDADGAVRVALADDRVHIEDPTVVLVDTADYGEERLRVRIRGEVTNRPEEVCSIGGISDEATGMVYLVSIPPATVEALTVEWGRTYSCLDEG